MGRHWKQADGSFPVSVNWDQINQIEGVILERKEVIVNGDPRMVMTIETDDGKVNVWESAGLRALFALEDGVYVKISYHGFKENPKNKRKFRAFTVEYDEGELAPEDQEKEKDSIPDPF